MIVGVLILFSKNELLFASYDKIILWICWCEAKLVAYVVIF